MILLASEKEIIQEIVPFDPECVKVEGGSGLFDVDKFVCYTRPTCHKRKSTSTRPVRNFVVQCISHVQETHEPNNNTRERPPMMVIS